MLLIAAWIAFPAGLDGGRVVRVGTRLSSVAAQRLGVRGIGVIRQHFWRQSAILRVPGNQPGRDGEIPRADPAADHDHAGCGPAVCYVRWSLNTDSRSWFASERSPLKSGSRGATRGPRRSLLALLAWYELRPISVADAWMVGGLILLEVGLSREKAEPALAGLRGTCSQLLSNFPCELECRRKSRRNQPAVLHGRPHHAGVLLCVLETAGAAANS